MKPRRLIARLAASSIALLALLAYSSPAGASGDYPLWTPTLTSTCANGAITAASASSGSVHLVGWVQPCASAAISDRWGIVGINTGLQDTVLELYPYAGAASVPFSVTAPLTGSLGQFDAVCVAGSLATNLGCVGVVVVGGVVTVVPISLNDPVLTLPRSRVQTNGNCGNCV